MSLFNDIKENFKRQKNINDQILSNPRFKEMDISKIKFYPIDGDIDRMKLYGCYTGDKFTYQGKEYTVEKDDVERLTFKPSFERVGYKEYRYEKKYPKMLKQNGIKQNEKHIEECIEVNLYQATKLKAKLIVLDIAPKNSQKNMTY